ncbi:hypothetical protein Ndes2526B_g07985 [Nannochloris sp. 'desiccata']|nr:putative Non-histone chromosomal protein 6 [Chlorella desiccata (nom. nud.)]
MSSQATEPLAEVDFDAELAALEQEQGASAAQELPHETIEATQEVSTDVADVKEASEDVMAPPPSSETTEALAEGEAPLCEEEKEVKTTQSPSTEPETSKKEVEVVEEEAPEPAAAARRSKPAAKKPLVGRKPLAAKKAEAAPAAEPSAPKMVKLLVKKARVVEVEVEEEEDNADASPSTSPAAASKPIKPSLVKKVVPVAATKKAPLLPKTKAPAVKKAPAATTTVAAPEGPLVKRAKNAYFIFNEENRAQVKEENPGAKMGDLNKLLGAAYQALSKEEKAFYVSKAAEDKERMERELAEGGVLPARKTKAAGAAAGAVEKKKPAAKRLNNSPYDLFCEEQRPILKRKNPRAGAPEISKLLSDAWKRLDDDEKAPYMQRSKELKAAAKEAAAAAAGGEYDDEEDNDSSSGDASGSKKRPTNTAARKVAAGTKRARVAAAVAAGDDDDEVMPDAVAVGDDEDDVDRENVDWEAHPAYSILSKTKIMYIVARHGLPLYEYGEVPIEAANLQLRAGQTPTNADGTVKPCPLTLDLLNEYDAFCKDFRRDVFDNSEGNELDLEHLRDGSLLEACSFLGSMRDAGHELAAPIKKDDVAMKVPTMATSRLMQRIINVERRKYEELERKFEEVKAQLAAALGEGGDSAAMVMVKGAGGADAQEAAIAEA